MAIRRSVIRCCLGTVFWILCALMAVMVQNDRSLISLMLSCPMDLRNFPMDVQVCNIELASYAYTTNDIIYKWKKQKDANDSKPIQLKPQVKSSLPSFDLADYNVSYCTSKTNTGEYSCLKTSFLLRRQFSYYLLQLYIPSSMLVIVSWVSFWLDKSAVPARVTLGVTTLLTMTTQASGINAKLPPVSYTKAIDIWIGVCMAFIFGALLEFACVTYMGDNNMTKRKQRAEVKKKESMENLGKPVQEIQMTQIKHYNSISPRLRHLPRLDDEEAMVMANPLIPNTNTSPACGVAKRVCCQEVYVPTYPEPTEGPMITRVSGFKPLKTTIQRRRKRMSYLCRPVYYFKRKFTQTEDRSKKIDYFSRVFFPTGFSLFNLIYWVIFK